MKPNKKESNNSKKFRKENLEKCLKGAEDLKKDAITDFTDLENPSSEAAEIILEFIQDEYQNKVNACNMLYSK